MGKGTIVSGGASGSYQVTLNLDRRRIAAGIAKANADIADVTGVVAEIQALINASNARLNDLQTDIDFYGSDLEHYQAEYDQAMKDYQAELVTYRGLASRKAYYNLVILSLQKRKQYLESTGEDPEVSAWCADLTEDLAGDVGTVEVAGERGNVIIRPGYDGGAVYSAGRDGQLQPAIAGTPESVFYNWSMLPGWQKWKPTFRTGEITSLDGDTCSVLLDAASSSAQSLDVNQAASLSNVPIEYMQCNGAAFAVGDSVLIEFTGQDWPNPKVIGFTSNPKPCGFNMVLTRADGTPVTDSMPSVSITVLNSSGASCSVSKTYLGDVPGSWLVTFTNPAQANDPDGYWVSYNCEHGVLTQYPARYKTADKQQAADLIKPGRYEDIVHFFRYDPLLIRPTPTYRTRADFTANPNDCSYVDVIDFGIKNGVTAEFVIKIYASVPAKVSQFYFVVNYPYWFTPYGYQLDEWDVPIISGTLDFEYSDAHVESVSGVVWATIPRFNGPSMHTIDDITPDIEGVEVSCKITPNMSGPTCVASITGFAVSALIQPKLT